MFPYGNDWKLGNLLDLHTDSYWSSLENPLFADDGSMVSTYLYWLVVSTPLKNMISSVGVTIPNIWKVIKKCSKPPTSYNMFYLLTFDEVRICSTGRRRPRLPRLVDDKFLHPLHPGCTAWVGRSQWQQSETHAILGPNICIDWIVMDSASENFMILHGHFYHWW